jgi:hypothetical protein
VHDAAQSRDATRRRAVICETPPREGDDVAVRLGATAAGAGCARRSCGDRDPLWSKSSIPASGCGFSGR